MKKWLLFLSLLVRIGNAQTLRVDSLKSELQMLYSQKSSYSKDTLLYNTLKALMWDYADIDIDTSVHYNTQLVKLCIDKKLQKELIYTYQYTGYLYQVKGDYHQSIQFYYKALILAEKLKQYIRIARSYGGLAHAYISLKKYQLATAYCKKGLFILRSHPDASVQMALLNALGALYREQHKLPEALKANQEMHTLAKMSHDLWYEAHGLHAIGWVYKEWGDMAKALAYYKKALSLCHTINNKDLDTDLEKSILLNITDIYSQQKKWPQALTFCKQARQTALRVKNSSIVAESNEKLYKIYKQTGQTANALKAYEEFISLRDTLSSEKNQQRIERLSAEYESAKKTATLQKQRAELLAEQNNSQQLAQTRNRLLLGAGIILVIASMLFWSNQRLQAKNQKIDQQRTILESTQEKLADINKTLEIRVDERTKELVTANNELTKKNEEIKAALFKGQSIERKRVALELHDNLSSLLSAVNMSIQAINPKNLSESEAAVYQNVKYLIQSAYAEVRNISHNILPAELEKEGLANTLTTLIGRLNQNSTLYFSLSLSGLLERLPVEIEFNVYSMVLELVNNAIKHAQATTVNVHLYRTDAGVDLVVTDNGVGIGQTAGKRGVGLQNIQTRLDSLGGIFTTTQPLEKGTQVHIKIPINT